jgi:hypothetical protein
MHKLTSANFDRENDDGETETVKGSLVVMPPNDGDYSPGRNIGQVVFVVDNEDEAKAESTTDKTQTGESDKPRSAPHPASKK